MGEITGAAAWYGAVVATLGFLFNVVKWLRERARLSVRIVRTVYDDGGSSKVEKTPDGGEISTPVLYYHVEVTNVGERPTTIMGVAATTKRTFKDKVLQPRAVFRGEVGLHGQVFTPHYTKRLPHVISPGEVWSCRVPVERVDGLKQAGRAKLELAASCERRPLLIPFPPPEKG